MPSPVHVKKAQQRYQMVPVLNEDGSQKQTPVKDKKTGEQKKDKRGNLVFMKVTAADKDHPLPMPECDYGQCANEGGKTIKVGTPYKHLTVKTGPYSSRVYTRHEECPSWNVWEYNFSTSSMVAQASSSMFDSINALSEPDDFESVKDEMEQLAQDLLDEKQGALDGMPEGLADGSELAEQVEALESWVDEISNAEKPDEPEAEQVERWYVINKDGSGDAIDHSFDSEEDADAAIVSLAAATGDDPEDFETDVREEDPEDGELSEDQLDAWLEEARGVLEDAANACEL